MAYTEEQLALRIKEKYPQYQGIDNSELVSKVIDKYPEYGESLDKKEYEGNLLTEAGKLLYAGGAQSVLNAGGGLAQAYGMMLGDKADVSDEAIDAYAAKQRGGSRMTRGKIKAHRLAKNRAIETSLENAARLRNQANGLVEALEINPEVAESLPGQVIRGLGQVPVSILAGLTGGAVAGPAGAVAGVVGVAAPQMTSEAISDAEATLGKSYMEMNEDERNQVALSTLGYTTLGTALETAGFLKAVPWMKRFLAGKTKVSAGQLKSLKREVAEGFAAEGFTEAGQGFLLDAFSKSTYDEDRQLMSAKALSNRFNEFLIGGLVGGIVSGTGGTLERAATGQLFKPRVEDTAPEDYVKDSEQTEGRKEYEVLYIDQTTGKEFTDVIEATSEEEARNIFTGGLGSGSTIAGAGFDLVSVKPKDAPEAPAPEPTPTPGPVPTEQPRPPDLTAEARATYMPQRFVGERAETAPPFFKRFQPEQYSEGRFVDIQTSEDLSDQTFQGGSIRIEDGRPALETSDIGAASIIPSKASEEGALVRTNLFKQKAGWKWTQAPEGEPSTIVSVEQGSKHYYTLDFTSNKPLTLKTYPDKKSEPRGRPTTRGEVRLGNKVGEIEIRGKKHPVYDTVTVGEPEVTAGAAPVRNNVSVEAASRKIQQEGLAREANEDFFQFWARTLDSVGKRVKASPRNFAIVAKQAVQDTMQFFKENPKFATYYQTDAALTRSHIEAVTGPITDSEFTLFRILAGLTSPSTKLPDNLIDALRVFKLYKDKGDFNFIVPSETAKGNRTYDKKKTGFLFRSTTGATKATSILALQQKIDEIGLDAALEYFVEPTTMQELVADKRKFGYADVGDKGKIRKVVKEATGQDKLIPRIFMFGPKVGAYTMNTMGYNEYTTTDIWESRFIRSYFKGMLEAGTGLPQNVDEQKIFQEFASNFNAEFEKQTGLRLDPADLQAVRWFYILNTFNKAGYTYAKTDDTISGYTARAARELYGINPEGRRPSVGEDTSEVFAKASAGNRAFNRPLQDATAISEEYSRSSGIPFQEPERITSVNVERAQRIGKAFDEMTPAPNDPEVKAAYDAMVVETLAQYETILRNGYSIEINNTEPYNNSQEMIEDLRNRKVMRVFSTEFGFGEGGITAKERAENPLLADTGLTDVNGVPLLVNDVFRFVHDFFGHAKLGNGFGPIGEENAWNVHSRMYSPLARKAMTTETRGQNSWVNFSGVNDAAFEIRDQAREARRQGREEEANRLTSKVYDEMRFADQKIGLLPDEFVRTDDEVTAEAGTVLRPDEQPVEGGFNSQAEMRKYINEEFLPIAEKLGIDIVPNFAAPVAQYNVTQRAIEYNPREMFKQSQDYIRSAMREEIIHAAMHKVLMSRSKSASPNQAWLNFFEQVGKDLTPEQRQAIEQVYRNLSDDVSYGAEYTRALIQQQLYGRVTEQDLRFGPAFDKIKQLIKSVQIYISHALKGMSDERIEAAAVIKESADLLRGVDPTARPANQATIDAANKQVQEDSGILTAEAATELAKPPKKKKKKKGPLSFMDKYINTADTVLRRIHPEIANLFQRYVHSIDKKKFDALKRTKPFIERYNKIKNKKDQRRLKQLLMYSPLEAGQEGDIKLIAERDALLRKYDMYNLYKTNIVPVLFRIRSEAQEQGVDIGFLEGYFPRRVIDYEGLRESFGRPIAKDFRSYVDEINRQRRRRNLEQGKNEPLVEYGSEEEALIFEKYIRNGDYVRRGVKTAKPRSTNQRTIELIPDKYLDFYDDPGSALEYYISSMIHATETKRVFGERYVTDGEDVRLAGEIGPLLQDLMDRGEINEEVAFRTLKHIASMILNSANRENVFLGNMRQFSYLTTMVEFTSTLSQLYDLPFILQRAGLLNAVNALRSPKYFKLEDYGIDNDRISDEFRDEKNFLTQSVKLGLKASGFTRLDQLLKETSLNAQYAKLRKDAQAYYKDRNSNRSKRFRTTIEAAVGKEQADATIAALKKGDRDNALVRDVVIRESLEKTQPITKMQMPVGVAANPNSRIAYQMKSFMVTQLNYVRNEILNEVFSGDKARATQGAIRLARLMGFMILVGLPVDALKDFLAGRLGYMSDYMFNSIFRIAGVSKYQVYQTKKEGIGSALVGYVTPITVQQFMDYTAEFQRVTSGDRALTASKLVSIAPFSDVLNRMFGFQQEKERREYIRRAREGELPTFMPPGSL